MLASPRGTPTLDQQLAAVREAQFSPPLMHVIDAFKRRVLWSEPHARSTWLDPRERIVRGGQTYKVVDQQHGGDIHNYYVWVECLGSVEA